MCSSFHHIFIIYRSSCALVLSVRLMTHTIETGTVFHLGTHFYPRYAMLARVIAIATCPSVRLSVTRLYCVMISSPTGSPTILAFWCQISSQNSKGFPPSRVHNNPSRTKVIQCRWFWHESKAFDLLYPECMSLFYSPIYSGQNFLVYPLE